MEFEGNWLAHPQPNSEQGERVAHPRPSSEPRKPGFTEILHRSGRGQDTLGYVVDKDFPELGKIRAVPPTLDTPREGWESTTGNIIAGGGMDSLYNYLHSTGRIAEHPKEHLAPYIEEAIENFREYGFGYIEISGEQREELIRIFLKDTVGGVGGRLRQFSKRARHISMDGRDIIRFLYEYPAEKDFIDYCTNTLGDAEDKIHSDIGRLTTSEISSGDFLNEISAVNRHVRKCERQCAGRSTSMTYYP